MTNYNFIGIGINSYQHLQPLSYAQADIEGLERFFCEEARLSSRQTLTFTDNSPWVNEEPTYPTKKNLLDWIDSGFSNNVSTASRSGASILWFAFSGYAVQHLGEDYLLPIDARLDDPAATGIPVREVFNALRQQGAGKIVALLDMNRSTAVVGNGEVGEQTLDLAGQMGIAAILSCKPEEFSHETAALGHGMFTASVLEALRYHRSELTLDLLNKYLGDRLEELSEHHWRPVQTPVMVIPSLAASRELILPTGETSKIHWQTAVPIGASLIGKGNNQEAELPPFTNGYGHSSHINMGTDDGAESLPTDQPAEVVMDDLDYPYSSDGDDLATHDFDEAPIDEDAIFVEEESDIDPTEPAMMPTGFGESSSKDKDKQPWYLAGWQWLMLLLLLLLAAFGWQAFKGSEDFNLASLQALIPGFGEGETDDPSATSPDGSSADGNATDSNDPNAVDGSGTDSGNVGENSTANDPNTSNEGDPALPTVGDAAGTDTENADGNNANANSGENNPDGTSGNTATGNDGASGNANDNSTDAAGTDNATTTAAENNNGQGNNATGTNTATAGAGTANGGDSGSGTSPTAENNSGNNTTGTGAATPSASTSVIVPNGAELQSQNERVLTQANQVLQSSQASSFNQAIAAARTIKPGTPLYNEARTQINRWSRVILDIAEARAIKGDIAGAIAAARLVPSDVPQVYGIAQNSIKKWEPQLAAAQKNRQVIANAQEEIIPNQASSYSRGINILKTIKPNEPAFAEARVLQDQWSRTIYLLANSRAAQGKFKLAVQTAKLVPADSPSRSAAEGAIARWNKGVR